MCELTEAAIVGEKLRKSLALRLVVAAAAAVAPRRQADTQRSHVVGRHHRTWEIKRKWMSAAMALPRPEPFSFHFASVSSASQNNKTLSVIADVHIRTPSSEAMTVALDLTATWIYLRGFALVL